MAMSYSQTMFILALLLSTVGTSTAHSPMRRALSVTSDGKVETDTGHSPMRRTLSVTSDGKIETESASLTGLASMFDEEGTELTQSLLMLAEKGAPREELLKMIREAKAEIPPWKSEKHAELQTAIDAIHQCASDMDGGVQRNQAKENACSAASTVHKSQRTEESQKFATKEHWEAQTAEKKEVMDTECKIFTDIKGEARAARAQYGGGDVHAYLKSSQQEFCPLLPRYRDAKEKCTTATTNHAEVSATFKTATTAYEDQVIAGDTSQTELDESCCRYSLATRDTCNSYDSCYVDKVAEYNSVKEVVEAEEKVKKVEWRILSRIECLVPILGTDNADEIEKCRKETYSLEGIAYPKIPGKDSCTIEAAYPGTEAYYKAHYASLPDNAKGEPVAECAGMSGIAVAKAKVAAPYCVEIVTGTAAHNGGTMDVHIDAGNGLEQAATGKHAKGSTVVHDCFETPVSALQVRNPTNDAWTGVMKYSTDGGTTYRSMTCASGCQAGQSTDGIVVDGNKDGAGQADTKCLSGATCTITQALTFTKVIYKSGTKGNSVDETITGTIPVTAGISYLVNVEVLRNDLASASEYVKTISLTSGSTVNLGSCNPDGGDYDCTFYNCHKAATITPTTSSISVSMVFTGHSHDCDCDTDSWQCSKQFTVPGRTHMKAVARFILTQAPTTTTTTTKATPTWTQIGTLGEMESLIEQYPLSEYTFGVKYNTALGDIHEVIVNSWNRGIRISTVDSYPQGDTGKGMTYGTTVFTKGLQQHEHWIQRYYQQGRPQGGWSNGKADGVQVFAMKLKNPWEQIGTLGGIEGLVEKYPLTRYKLGVMYNTALGDIHKVIFNSWNKGTRISVADLYPQGDNSKDMTYGTTVFTKGLDQNAHWIQYYYQQGKAQGHSNGNSDHVRVFAIDAR